MSRLLHASAVALDGAAIMLRGPSGSGKSTICLALIEHYGAQLIADDRLYADTDADTVMLRPHDGLAGLIEMRGLGVLRMAHLPTARLALVVELVAADAVPRIAPMATTEIAGCAIALLRLHGHDPYTPLKIHRAAAALRDGLRDGLRGGFRDDAIYTCD